MTTYNHLLVALDLSDESGTLVAKARQLAQANNAQLSLINIVEQTWLYGPYVGIDVSQVVDEVRDQANKKMAEISGNYDIAPERCIVEEGIPKVIINEYAQEHDVDLIVLGSHARHGLGLLLGSTANGVLHHAPCDVLCVRLGDG